HGTLGGGIDMLPKPVGAHLPVLITGGAQQSPDWIATHGDGWMTYPRDVAQQAHVVRDYRARVASAGSEAKPVMQSLYVDLAADDDTAVRPIHLGFRSGVSFLKSYLGQLRTHGINHVALNLRFNQADLEDTMKRLADEVLPEFSTLGNRQ
ncbi:MAG: LLM class flavin-dependent oxidoreductase, partial [Pseudomonadota bacterium]